MSNGPKVKKLLNDYRESYPCLRGAGPTEANILPILTNESCIWDRFCGTNRLQTSSSSGITRHESILTRVCGVRCFKSLKSPRDTKSISPMSSLRICRVLRCAEHCGIQRIPDWDTGTHLRSVSLSQVIWERWSRPRETRNQRVLDRERWADRCLAE